MYLTTHSTHFIYGYMASDKGINIERTTWKEEGRKCLFNDAFNTLNGAGHMVKDHSDSERGYNHMGYSFRLAARVLLYV